MYSQVLDDDELVQRFPGQWRNLSLCLKCFYEMTAGFGPARKQEQPPLNSEAEFRARLLKSAVATNLTKALFETAGYEVKHSGYEFDLPEWMARMQQGDANHAVRRVRSFPDLRVFDTELNSLYEVEVKATTLEAPAWRYRKHRLDQLSLYYPEAILAVCHLGYNHYSMQRVSALNLANRPRSEHQGHVFYEFDLNEDFLAAGEIFPRITEDVYETFRNIALTALRGFATEVT